MINQAFLFGMLGCQKLCNVCNSLAQGRVSLSDLVLRQKAMASIVGETAFTAEGWLNAIKAGEVAELVRMIATGWFH
jgi:hypothetical protein